MCAIIELNFLSPNEKLTSMRTEKASVFCSQCFHPAENSSAAKRCLDLYLVNK